MLSKKEVKQGKYSEMGMKGRKKWRGILMNLKIKNVYLLIYAHK